MDSATMSATNVFNFAVCGNVRSGSAVVQSAISNLKHAICHENLLHADEKIRSAEHESYFGSSDLPEWYNREVCSPWQYINHQVFDNPKNDEKAIGLRISYPQLHSLELYDLLHDKCAEGDFGLVHVVRNPVACFVSLQQARSTNVWSRPLNDRAISHIPSPVVIVPSELVDFVRQHEAVKGKVERACDDKLVVKYVDLLFDFQATMAKVVDFIELPPALQLVPMCRRLRNRSMRERISNFHELQVVLPADVRSELLAEDCC